MVGPFDETYYIKNGQIDDRPALGWYKKLSKKYLDTSHMLDFGCGTGTVIERLSALGQIDGFDTSEFALNKAKLRNPKSVLYGQLDEISSSTFSAVVSVHVFEHLGTSELNSAIEILVRSLRANGRFLIVTPQFDGFVHKRTGSLWSGFSDNTHCNLMTAQNVRDLLSRNGFSLVREFADGPWNGPYITITGLKMEKFFLQVLCAIQVLSGRKFLSLDLAGVMLPSRS